MEYILMISKTIFFYFVILIVYRIMGKREIGELSVIDLVNSFLIAELAAINIDKSKSNILLSLIPIIIILVITMIIAKISRTSPTLRNVTDGKPSILIKSGKVCFEELVKQKYSIDDLLTSLRNNSIKSIEEVDYAVLETNGTLSIFEKNKTKGLYPLPIIMDGKIEEETLENIEKTQEWLIKKLKQKSILLEDVFYAFYRNNNLYIIENKTIN